MSGKGSCKTCVGEASGASDEAMGRPSSPSDGMRLLDDNSFNKKRRSGPVDSVHVVLPAAPEAAPVPPLAERTVKAKLGECDAFLSHSWRDEGHLKWARLCEWSYGFENKHGRLPSVWLDKGCMWVACTAASSAANGTRTARIGTRATFI